MENSKFCDRLIRLIEDDSTFESEHGGYMGYDHQISLDEAGYLVPIDQFQAHLGRYAQEIQKAVNSNEIE